MEDFAQQLIVFGEVHAKQRVRALAQRHPDNETLLKPVVDRLAKGLNDLYGARFCDPTLRGQAFPKDFLTSGISFPCNAQDRQRAKQLQASIGILLADEQLLQMGIDKMPFYPIETPQERKLQFAQDVKGLLLSSFICVGLLDSKMALYEALFQVNVTLEDLRYCHNLHERLFPGHGLNLLHGLLVLYRQISGDPARNGPAVVAEASRRFEEIRDRCSQGNEAHKSLVLDLEGTGDARQPSFQGHATASMSAVGAVVHSGITDALQMKATIQDRRAVADDEGMMDESA